MTTRGTLARKNLRWHNKTIMRTNKTWRRLMTVTTFCLADDKIKPHSFSHEKKKNTWTWVTYRVRFPERLNMWITLHWPQYLFSRNFQYLYQHLVWRANRTLYHQTKLFVRPLQCICIARTNNERFWFSFKNVRPTIWV